MYHHVTTNHCLYSISQEQLAYFKAIASVDDMYIPFDHIKALNVEDKLTTVLQVWCMLNEEQLDILPIPEKLMPYTSNYYILNLIKTNKQVKSFMARKPHPQQIYRLSYYLTIVTLQWCDELMTEYNVNPYLGRLEQPSKYYLFLAEKKLEETQFDTFYIFQKKWANLIATDYQCSNRFHRYIEDAMSMTMKHSMPYNLKRMQVDVLNQFS